MADQYRTTSPQTSRPDEQSLSLASILGVLRRRKLLFALVATVVLLLFVAAAFLLPPKYEAEALLAVEPAVELDERQAAEIDVQRHLATISDTLLRRSRIEEMAQEVDLLPDARYPLGEDELAAVRSRIEIRAESPRTFTLGFTGEDRDRATEAVNWLADTLITSSRTEREDRAEATAAFLEEQVRPVEMRLREIENEIEAYQQRYAHEIPAQAPTSLKLLETSQARLQENSKTIADAEARLAAVERELAELRQQGLASEAPQHPAEARLAELRAELRNLRQRYTDNHPDVVRAREQVQDLEQAIAAGDVAPAPPRAASPTELRVVQLEAEREAAIRRLARARQERSTLLADSAGYQSRVEAAPRHETVLAALEREYDATRERYERLRDELHQAERAERLEQTERGAIFRMVEPPRVPEAPASPNKPRILLMGLLASLGLGFAAVFVAEQADHSYREPADVEADLRLPVLAAVPWATAKRGGAGEPVGFGHVPVLDDPRGPMAEQYRMLATRMIQRAQPGGPLSLVVTSPVGSEGKTTTAVNLALALGRMVDDEVLLVDADMGRPSAHRLVRVARKPGLSDLLGSPQDDPEAYVERHHGLALLQAGSIPPEERAALSSPHGQRVFQRLRQRFRYVVVDAPPILAVAEGLVLQRLVDSALLVVRARKTPRDVVRQAVRSLDRSRLAGVILNDAEPAAAYLEPYRYAERSEPQVAVGGGAGR